MVYESINKLRLGILFKTFFIFLLFFVCSDTTFASAKLYFTGPNTAIAPEGEFVVSVMVDTTNTINAIDLDISYVTNIFKFLDFNNAGSIVDFWQSSPSASEDGTKGKIKLSGGIMHGFSGTKGLIVKLYFKVLSQSLITGGGDISFSGNNLYIADGKGTLLVPVTSSLKISVKEGARSISIEEIELKEYVEDITPPELVLTTVKNPSDNLFLVVFNATDRESGVAGTQIRFKKWFSFSEWQDVQNPVLYPKGAWVIELKAKNNALLESTEILKTSTRLMGKIAILLFTFIFLVILAISLYNRRRRTI